MRETRIKCFIVRDVICEQVRYKEKLKMQSKSDTGEHNKYVQNPRPRFQLGIRRAKPTGIGWISILLESEVVRGRI